MFFNAEFLKTLDVFQEPSVINTSTLTVLGAVLFQTQ